MSFIEIKNLTKTFHDNNTRTSVLKGIDLTISEAETVVLVGPSGAGKSTLLHIIGTLDRPTSGEVLFEGRDLFSWKEKALGEFRNRTVGFVFQFHHLLADFTALENVMMPLLIRGEKRERAEISARECLERVGLDARLVHRPSELSGGEQQRVAIARALVGKPRLILADEPTGNLDSASSLKIFDLLLSANKELKTTLVVVTHNEGLAQTIGRPSHGRIVPLIDGKIAKA